MWLLDLPVQVAAVGYKALLLGVRRRVSSVIRLTVPVICILAIWILLYHYGQPSLNHPKSSELPTIPKCVVGPKKTSCTTLLYYAPNELQFVEDVMKNLCDMNDPKLKFGVDVKRTNFTGRSLTDYMYAKYNTTQGAVDFQTITLNGAENSTLIRYQVLYNDSYITKTTMTLMTHDIRESNFRLNMARATDAAILRTLSQYEDLSPASVSIEQKDMPDTGYATQVNYVVLNQLQLCFYYVAFTIGALFTLTSIVKEKMKGMRGYLKLLGMHDSAFWIATFLEHATYLSLSVGIALLFGNVLPQLDFFGRCSIWVSLLVFLLYSFTMLALSAFLSTVIGKTAFANILGSLIFLVGLGFALFWSIADTMSYTLWRSRLGMWFSLFPPFLFLKMMMDIKVLTVGPASTNIFPQGTFTETNHYSWDDMFQPLPIYASNTVSRNSEPIVPTTWDSLMYMLVECCVLLLLTVYADIVFPTKHKPGNMPWFFLMPSYWGFTTRPPEDMGEDSTLIDGEQVALRVRHMSKDYKKGMFKTGAISALRPFCVTIPTSTVFCMLGHNGAGKTTAINCFIGLQSPTHGDALIFGRNIVKESSAIHEMMGICPQFDMLWDEITAWEHMRICNMLKPAADRNTTQELEEKLYRVRLHNHGKQATKQFSGGMKRRLSFVLSTIGNPKVIFLDEPTTGMDPGNRNFVWDMIKEIKKSRLVILTTHSMEEADMLGDRIAIMAQGKLRAEGNSLSLKKQFGSGYRVNINAEVEKLEDVKAEIRRMLPGAQLVQENAGSLVYGLPDVDPDGATARFFKFLQSQSGELINDWGIHNTSLEDVFVSITRKILGQDLTYVDASGKHKQSKRDQDERAYFRETTRRMQLHINSLQNHVEVLNDLLRAQGIKPPPMEVLTFVSEEATEDFGAAHHDGVMVDLS